MYSLRTERGIRSSNGADYSYSDIRALHTLCKGSILFDLVSYCDVLVQSNPWILEETSVY